MKGCMHLREGKMKEGTGVRVIIVDLLGVVFFLETPCRNDGPTFLVGDNYLELEWDNSCKKQ